MATDKQDKFVEQMMADCDVPMIAAREASQVSDGSVIEQEVLEEDFVRQEGQNTRSDIEC
jgi:hypothetical protein